MKQIKKSLIIVTLAASAMASLFGSYRFGSWRSTERSRILYGGTFVSDFTVLQDLRNNRNTEAIDSLESHCYCWAKILLDHPAAQNSVAIKTFMPELVKYRDQYASDPAKWSPTEQGLEELLTKGNWRKANN